MPWWHVTYNRKASKIQWPPAPPVGYKPEATVTFGEVDGWPYVVGVDVARDRDGRDIPIGLTIQRKPSFGDPGPSPQYDLEGMSLPEVTDAALELQRLSVRDVKRMPLDRILRAATVAMREGAWGGPDSPVTRTVLPRKKVRLTRKDFEKLAKAYEALEARGERPVPVLAKRMGVPENRMHQWVHRMRYEMGLLPPPPRRQQAKP